MEGEGTTLQIAPNALEGRNRHICAFFNGLDERYQVLCSFIKEGFDQAERAVHIVDPSNGPTTSSGSVKQASTWSGPSGLVNSRCGRGSRRTSAAIASIRKPCWR
jgi:hypothetical protein